MLSWLAVQVERPTIEADLERRSGEALAASGHDWAVVAFDGRDGLLAGEPGNEQQRHEALALVRSVWGVRVVRTRTGATTTIMDVPITPASEPPPPDRPLGDQAPEAVVSHLPPATTSSAAAILLAEVAPATPTESLQAREEHAASAPPLTSEASASAIAAPSVEQPAPELPAPKTALAPAATSAEHTSVPPSMPSEAQAVPADAADVPPPEPKQAAPSALAAKRVPDVVAAAVTQESATLPPKPDAEAARIAARVDLPERKPALAAASPEPSAAGAGDAADAGQPPASAPAATAARRFETAALPPGNIGAVDACLDDVRGAARRLELHFARGDARLDSPGKALIDGLISTLNACPEATLHIGGHADATGKARHNQVLSRHRARGVASYMADKGIDAGRLVAIGYGDKRPVAPNDTQANRARNRRIELTVTARAAPLPPMPIRKQGTRNGLSHR